MIVRPVAPSRCVRLTANVRAHEPMSRYGTSAIRIFGAAIAFTLIAFLAGWWLSIDCTLVSHLPVPWQCNGAMFLPVAGSLFAGLIAAEQSPLRSTLQALVGVLIGLLVAVPLGYLRGWYGDGLGFALGVAVVGGLLPAVAAASLASHFHAWRVRSAL